MSLDLFLACLDLLLSFLVTCVTAVLHLPQYLVSFSANGIQFLSFLCNNCILLVVIVNYYFYSVFFTVFVNQLNFVISVDTNFVHLNCHFLPANLRLICHSLWASLSFGIYFLNLNPPLFDNQIHCPSLVDPELHYLVVPVQANSLQLVLPLSMYHLY